MALFKQLWFRVLIGMIGGATIGFALSPWGFGLLSPPTALAVGSWMGLPGKIFVGLLSMVIVPLVACSIVLGVSSSNDKDVVGKIFIRIAPYFVVTAFLIVLMGVGLAEIIKPGHVAIDNIGGISREAARALADKVIGGRTLDGLSTPQRLANLVPANPLRAALDVDMLQIVIVALLVGLAVLNVKHPSIRTFTDLCEAGQEISMKIIGWAMQFAPVAVFGLVADVAIRQGPSAFIGLGRYVVCVLLGLALIMVFYLLIVTFIARRSPIEFIKAIRTVVMVAFSTSSSAATMPVTLQTAEERLGVHPYISRFVVPIGATVNMDGTAVYQAIAAVFLCQFFGVDLSFGELVLLSITVVGSAIGTPAMPGVGIVILSTIVAGLGVPPEGIGMILGVDRILDMCRTSVNVVGDLVGSVVMARWVKPPAVQ